MQLGAQHNSSMDMFGGAVADHLAAVDVVTRHVVPMAVDIASRLAVTNRFAPVVPPVTLFGLCVAPVSIVHAHLAPFLIVDDVALNFAQVAEE